MFEECLKKQQAIKELFSSCTTPEEKYQKLIELGRNQPHLDPRFKTPEYLVKGCQSQMYLKTTFEGGKILFESEADALISAGLGVLLTSVYSGESPETVLKCPPTYLDELGIVASLTPNRANGLASLFLRMKQEALRCLIDAEKLKK